MSVRGYVARNLRKLEKTFITYNRIDVSKSALLSNFDLFAKLSGKQIIPVLKSNAYGHGIVQVAEALKDRKFPYLAVDGYFEALRIREVSRQPVLIMGAIRPENFKKIQYDKFAFVVHDEPTIRALGETGKRIKIHLEINTGMNRHGILPAEALTYLEIIKDYPKLDLEGVMSHLADSDAKSDKSIQNEVQMFDQTVNALIMNGAKLRVIHIAQSAGSLKAKSKYANAIRLGIGLYGVNPFPANHKQSAKLKNLKPGLQLISTITKVHELKRGDKVSYNYTFTAPKAMRVGILPIGYYEGVNRALSNAGVVKRRAKYLPIVGRVNMNHTIINLEGTSAKAGDEVIVYGGQPGDRVNIDAVASQHHLFNYSLLTSLSSDVRRVLID